MSDALNNSINMQFVPLRDLFEEDSPAPKGSMKQNIIEHLRLSRIAGVPEYRVNIDLEPDDGSDIIVRVVDLENALGYRVYKGEEDYFNQLSADLHVPQESDFRGGG